MESLLIYAEAAMGRKGVCCSSDHHANRNQQQSSHSLRVYKTKNTTELSTSRSTLITDGLIIRTASHIRYEVLLERSPRTAGLSTEKIDHHPCRHILPRYLIVSRSEYSC